MTGSPHSVLATSTPSPTDPPAFLGPFKGTVEQRTDPQRLGRLKVRVAGLMEDIPVEHLPWIWPALPAWQNGGIFFVPPIGSVVWVDFENGDHEYAVWRCGWWGQDETAQGTGAAAHRQWPTSWFGGQARTSGLLALEKVPGVKATDAPDNFSLTSPLQKRLEMDDRYKRERIVLADRHDNMLWVNSEDGILSLEAAGGEQQTSYAPMGIVFSSKPGVAGIQAYTFGRWQLTVSDTERTAELSSPRGNRLRLSDKDQRVEMWTIKGHKVVMDDTSDSIQFLTSSGAGLFVKGGVATLAVGQDLYLTMNLTSGEVILKCAGDLRLHSGGDAIITADGKATIDGTQGVYLNTHPFSPPPAKPVDPVFTAPETMERIPRACDYPHYASP